ncbi:carboxypeptidase regulatory-like domain-containing protein [bacterium]|nr:carboxypeptidase regulatory-like domain-containing protein [bacterium]
MKNYFAITKLILCVLSLFTFFVVIGCSDNPMGTETVQTPTTPDLTATPGLKVYGSITFSNNSSENCAIILTNKGTDESPKTVNETTGFSFNGLSEGYYSLEIPQTANYYSTVHHFYLTENKELTIRRVAKNGSATSFVNLYGKVLDVTSNLSVPYTSVTAVNETTNQTTEGITIVDGSFYFLGLASGTYQVTFKNGAFNALTKSLSILDNKITFEGIPDINVSSPTAFNDVSNNALSGYNLGNILIVPKVTLTGFLVGKLTDINGAPIATTAQLALLYDNDINDELRPTVISYFSLTNPNGYFLAKNLPRGFYAIVYRSHILTATTDSAGDIKGYVITSGGIMNTFLEVIPGQVINLPTVE